MCSAEKLLEVLVVAIELIASRSIDAATEISAIAHIDSHFLSLHTSPMDGIAGNPMQQLAKIPVVRRSITGSSTIHQTRSPQEQQIMMLPEVLTLYSK